MRFRTPFGALAAGAIVFAMVFAAAAALTVNTAPLPQSGSDVTAACDADGVDVTYTVVGSGYQAEVTEFVVSDIECAGYDVTVETTNYAFTNGTQTAGAAPDTLTFTLTAAVGVAAFDPGTVYVTLVP